MKKNTKLSFLLLFLCCLSLGASAQNLEDYLRLAANNNAGLKAAYAQFEASMRQVPQVKSLPDPTLSVSAFGQMVETRLGPQEAKFNLMQMFPWFGTLDAREDQALLAAEAKFQAFLDARNKLFYQVSKQYYLLFELQESLRFEKENLKILENYKNLALAKVRSGSGALADVLRTDVLRNESLAMIEIIEMQKKPALSQFYALLNIKVEDLPVIVPAELNVPVANTDRGVADSISTNEINTNPRLEELEKMAAAARAQETVARKNGMPSVGIGVDYMLIGKRTDMNPEGNGRDAIMPMLSVSLPIFRNKYKAAMEEARFMEESYVQQKTQLENDLNAEFEAVAFEAVKALRMLELYEDQVKSTQQVLDLLLSSYSNAQATFEEVLNERQELLNYQLAKAKAESSYWTAVARMNYITGNSYDYDNQE